MPQAKLDIVKRLKANALPDPHDEREVMHAPLLREAAEEIERIRGREQELSRRMLEARDIVLQAADTPISDQLLALL